MSGIYQHLTKTGLQDGDFVIYQDHRKRWRTDLITTKSGNHITLGPTGGEATQRLAVQLAEEESHKRGFLHAVVVRQNKAGDTVQIGNILNGRWQEAGGAGASRVGRDPAVRRDYRPGSKGKRVLGYGGDTVVAHYKDSKAELTNLGAKYWDYDLSQREVREPIEKLATLLGHSILVTYKTNKEVSRVYPVNSEEAYRRGWYPGARRLR